MIEYDRDSHTMDIYCDGREGRNNEDCDQVATYYGDWQECIDEAKQNEWAIVKGDSDEWFHYCPDHNPFRRPSGAEMFKD